MSVYSKSYNEKRNFFRMMVKAKVKFKLPGDDRIYDGVTEDLSAIGILFSSKCHLKTGQQIEIEILPDGDQNESLKATVEIIRVDVGANGQFVAAGNMSEVN